jgi:uncharacterized protein
MQHKKIIIAGGSGFIGQALCNYFGLHNQIVVLGRQATQQPTNANGQYNICPAAANNIRYVKWDAQTTGHWISELDGADLLINLTGKTVNCRYTHANKKAIVNSRIDSTNALGKAIQKAKVSPKLWINAASATIYPHATDTPRDENFTNFANDFSVQVCQRWEDAFFSQHTPNTRKVALRMAITLGEGGVMLPYFNLLKYGLGGRQGSGHQWFSWVHVQDTCRMIEWLAENTTLQGVYNCVSPNAVTNNAFMQTLRQVTGYSVGLPTYKWMLYLGAIMIATEPELVLKSRWVLPNRIMQSGFQFKYPLLQQALKDIIAQTPRQQYHLF